MHITFLTKLGPLGHNVSSRPDFDEDWTPEELDQMVSNICGTPKEKCREIGGEYFRQIRQCPTMRRVFGLFGEVDVKPTTGGVASTPDGFHTAKDLKADILVNYTAEVIDAWQNSCTIEKVGEEGPAFPIIEMVYNGLTGTQDTYTDLQMVRMLGSHLPFNKLKTDQGVFMATGENGPWVRLNTYGQITDRQIFVLIPAGTTGGIRLKVINETHRETVYGIVLFPEVPPPQP